MATLHNRVSRKELKQRALQDTTPRTTISFYCYFPIQDPVSFRNTWYTEMSKLSVLGRIYIAHEGVNAQISCPDEHIEVLRSIITSDPAMQHIRLNKAVDENRHSFYVLDIKVRNKIVADGIEDASFSMQNKGKYVSAEMFNEMVKDPHTMVIDMRNHYEYEVGRFKNAVEIPSDTFREQLPMAAEMFKADQERNIIMYCTGGIRCEKASAWMLHNGYKNVFHLEGGIINYINNVREKKLENHFIGKNFVFDERLGERITDDILSSCHICGQPCDTHVNCANAACHLLFIQCDACKEKLSACCSKECQDFIHMDAGEQKRRRQGVDKGRNIFNKSKKRMEGLSEKKDPDL